MELSEHYLSFVVDHIQSLKNKLENQTLCQLEKEFIERKIEYLKRLTDLPLLMTITNMSSQELEFIKEQYGSNNGDTTSFLIQLFELEKLNAFIKQPKHVTLEYIKETLITDFDAMTTLMELYNRNFEYERKKQILYGNGSNETVSYLQLYHDEKKLHQHKNQIEDAILNASQNFDLKTIRELRSYQSNRKKPLSIEFILKHKDKVEKNPETKKLAKRLTRTGFLGKLDQFLPFRKKREQKYLNAILEDYQNNNSLSILGISNPDITTMNEHQIKSLIKRIKKQTTYHRNKMNEAETKLKTSKAFILQKIKEYEELQKQDKKRFMELLASKIDYLPKRFQDQIWNEPNFKESLIRLSCYVEEKTLIEQLKAPVQNKDEMLTQISIKLPKTYFKKIA